MTASVTATSITASVTPKETPTPQTGTMADVFALVPCTPAQGSALLNSMAEDMRDSQPELAKNLLDASAALAGMAS